MLSRFSEVLQTAVDVVAPPATQLQDFMYHWKVIKHFYSNERREAKVHINETSIPSHLNDMLDILVMEESIQNPDGTLGPCLEFLLYNRPLDLLVDLASCDSPPGTRLSVLSWFRKMMSCLNQSPLDHASIFQPLKQLLSRCNGDKASPTENEEISLLLAVCGLVRKFPNMANLFLKSDSEPKPTCDNSSTATPTKNRLFDFDITTSMQSVSIVPQPDVTLKLFENTETRLETGSEETETSEEDIVTDRFILMDTLVEYLNSADSHIVLRACEGALVLASLPPPYDRVLQGSIPELLSVLVDRTGDLFRALPASIDPTDVDDLTVSWGLASNECIDEFPGSRQLSSLLCWLDYCDSLCRESPHCVGPPLAAALRERFFQGVLQPALSMHHAVLVTAVISKCIKQVTSKCLSNEIAEWLVGPISQPVEPQAYESVPVQYEVWPLLEHLINNCQHHRNDLSLETLRLFEVLIEKPNEHVLHRLLFLYINTRGYYDTTALGSLSWSDEEDERDRRRMSAQGAPKSKTLAPTNILKVVNSFLLLLPRNMLSDSGEVGYEEYMHDANRHYQAWLNKTQNFRWPVEAVWPDREDSASCDSRPESDHHLHSPGPGPSLRLLDAPEKKISTGSAGIQNDLDEHAKGDASRIISDSDIPTSLSNSDTYPTRRKSHGIATHDSDISDVVFYEGPFLRMLFTRLRSLCNQPYELSLQVTAILSKLALLPHPYLHELLLGPGLPRAEGVNTLWSVLQALSKQILSEVPRVQGFKEIIVTTRNRLLGDTENDSSESNPLFESLIVLEEFCKELAAIAFVKYHHATE